MDERELIENPEALGMLVQQAVQHLIQQRPDTSEQEAQLREVARTIERLEKLGLSIPEELRRLKTNLAAQTDQQPHFEQQLRMLGASLAESLEMIETALGQSLGEEKTDKNSASHPRRRRSNSSRTTWSVLKDYVFEALTDLGGSAHCSEVLDRVQELCQDKLLPGDLKPHKVYGVIWRYNAHWAYQKLIHEGIARRTSQRGYWELNPDAIKQ